jgi:uncharacterized membrane protein YsdA (DUF1294 family)
MRPDRPRQRGRRASQGPAADWLALPAFACVYLLLALFWQLPRGAALVYLASSLVCGVAYAIDKSAARAGRWRVAEKTLLMLGLVGGWPGAIVAQQVLRHKTSKAAFRMAFWATVCLNVAVFVVLASPQGRGFFQLPH